MRRVSWTPFETEFIIGIRVAPAGIGTKRRVSINFTQPESTPFMFRDISECVYYFSIDNLKVPSPTPVSEMLYIECDVKLFLLTHSLTRSLFLFSFFESNVNLVVRNKCSFN